MKQHTLKDEFQYYLDHQSELVEKYDGEYIGIRDNVVLGAYKTREEALRQLSKKYELGTFLIQLVGSGEENYTRTFHSRMANAKAI